MQSIFFLVIVGAAYLIKPVILPGHTIQPISTLGVISEVRPGKHNMVNYLYTDFPKRSMGYIANTIVIKALNSLKNQFVVSGSGALFTYSMNLLLVPFFLLLLRFKRLDEFKKQFVLLTLIFFIIYISTIVFFENQYRFSVTLVPMLLICLVWWLQSSFSTKRVYLIFRVAIGLFLVTDIGVAYGNRQEAIADAKLKQRYQELKSQPIGSKNLMIEWTEGKQLLPAYVFLPAYCYYFPPDADVNNLQMQAEKLNTHFYILRKKSLVYKSLAPSIIKEEPVDPKKGMVLIEVATNKIH